MIKKIIFRFAESSFKTKLIETSLQYVPKYGWNTKPIHVACALLDLSPAAHKIISPYDMIAYSMRKWNQQSLRLIDDTNFQGKKRITQKVQMAIKTRLEKQIPYIDTWAQAMAIGAHPDNIATTKNLLWDYSSEVWYRCGDKSTDYNYYSKRILFNSAYAATELFMLTDKSPGYFSTWEFLNRRLQNIINAGKVANDLGTVLSHAGQGVMSLFTMFKTPQKYQDPIEIHQANLQNNQSHLQNNQSLKSTSSGHQTSTNSQSASPSQQV